MSSYAGTPFKVFPTDGQFPLPAWDGEKYVYSCRAYVETAAFRRQLANKVSVGTWKRPLGTISTIFHMDAGKGTNNLVVPNKSGALKTHKAVMTDCTDNSVYANHFEKGFVVNMTFGLTSDPLDND